MQTPTTFHRARRPEQKEQRRAAILDVARELAAERGVGEVTLTEIASRVGLAKSNVLRYFETREEVYLHLLVAEWDDFKTVAAARLRSGRRTPAGIAKALADTAAERPLFCDLQSQAASVLEHNVSEPTARYFKLAVLAAVAELAAVIGEVHPALAGKPARTVVTTFVALVSGLWPIANPSPRVAELLEDPDLVHGRIDFQSRLRGALEPLIIGLIELRRRRSRT
jgi:AcrR family transcriptional regulator